MKASPHPSGTAAVQEGGPPLQPGHCACSSAMSACSGGSGARFRQAKRAQRTIWQAEVQGQAAESGGLHLVAACGATPGCGTKRRRARAPTLHTPQQVGGLLSARQHLKPWPQPAPSLRLRLLHADKALLLRKTRQESPAVLCQPAPGSHPSPAPTGSSGRGTARRWRPGAAGCRRATRRRSPSGRPGRRGRGTSAPVHRGRRKARSAG